jgi:hypothetical protein
VPQNSAATRALEAAHAAHGHSVRRGGNHVSNRGNVGAINVHGAGVNPEQVAEAVHKRVEKHAADSARGARMYLGDHYG